MTTWTTTADLAPMRLSALRGSDLAARVPGPLGAEVVVAGDRAEVDAAEAGCPVYRVAELREVLRMGATDSAVSYHRVKAVFDDAVAGVGEEGFLREVDRRAAALGWSEAKMRRTWTGWGEAERAEYLEHRQRALDAGVERLTAAQYAVHVVIEQHGRAGAT